jgi:hypothetical protein
MKSTPEEGLNKKPCYLTPPHLLSGNKLDRIMAPKGYPSSAATRFNAPTGWVWSKKSFVSNSL